MVDGVERCNDCIFEEGVLRNTTKSVDESCYCIRFGKTNSDGVIGAKECSINPYYKTKGAQNE